MKNLGIIKTLVTVIDMKKTFKNDLQFNFVSITDRYRYVEKAYVGMKLAMGAAWFLTVRKKHCFYSNFFLKQSPIKNSDQGCPDSQDDRLDFYTENSLSGISLLYR